MVARVLLCNFLAILVCFYCVMWLLGQCEDVLVGAFPCKSFFQITSVIGGH